MRGASQPGGPPPTSQAQPSSAIFGGVALLVACSTSTPAPAPTLHFVRSGLLVDGAYTARVWTPGESVTIGKITAIAPRLAECVEVARVDLGEVSRMTVAGAPAPDTDLAFSPDGALLAVGSFLGEVVVLDVATGGVKARRTLGEAMVRRVAWAPDGKTLYAGEQSPDASLRALDSATLEDRWRLDLAERVGRSTLPAGEDLYGIYSLPGVYGLEVLAGGDILVSAAHGWTDKDGARLNRSQLLRVRPDGTVVSTWPPEPADLVLLHPAIDEAGGRVAVPVTRSASGPAPEGFPIGGLQLLELDGLRPVGSVVVPPLAPWFTSTFLWQAHDLDVARDTVLLGLGDGRLVLASQDGTLRTTVAGGSPVLAGDVPVAASIGHGLLVGDSAVYLTSGTNIPWGAAAPDLRPPSPHPDESTLFVTGLDGARRWSFHGAWDVQGLTLAPDGQTLVVGAGERHSDSRRDLYGALLFDLGGPARDGDARLLTTCTTEGPVFFQQAVSKSGVVALAEVPYPTGDGGIAGGYRVVLFQ